MPSGRKDSSRERATRFSRARPRASSGTVAASAKAGDGQGVGITFEHGRPQPAAGDFVLVSAEKPGDAQAGWWVTANGGASFGTEFKDLAPNSPGRQALRIESAGVGQTASVNSYFDSTPGRSFVQLRGAYTLQFRAKSLAGARAVQVKLERPGPGARGASILLADGGADPGVARLQLCD